MISSNSTWDRVKSKPSLSPAFSRGLARVVYEFGNRKTRKIFSHRLGRITFRETLGEELTESRNDIITEVYKEVDVKGYRYKSVSHSHILPTLLSSNLDIYGHGSPIKGAYENCAIVGAICADGTDTKCEVGKCVYGRLTQVSGEKWRYDSSTVPGLYYFVYGRESVTLKTIARGKFSLPAGAGEVEVKIPASISATVYLPPKTYSKETFVRQIVKRFNREEDVRSVTDSVDNFIRSLIGTNQATVEAELEVKNRLLSSVESVLDPIWYSFVRNSVDNVWATNPTNRDFLIECYQVLTDLYERGVQVALSGIKASRINRDTGIGRPVYGRLPGISGAYNDEVEDTPAKWLTSGADNELSSTKSLIDSFYRNYLNPETCYPLNLDWLAQHFGFTSNLWGLSWPSRVKRLLLANAHVNNVDTSNALWTKNPDQDTLRQIDFSRIERTTVNISTGSVTTAYRCSARVYNSDTNLTSIDEISNLVIDISAWPGILPSRGSMVTLLFMLWAFGIKAHSPEELSYNTDDNTFSVRSGLRSAELNSPVNIPYMVDVLKVGTDTDAEVGNYPNQLIADVSTCQDKASANTVVIRMPFYYNRNGRSWDAASSIVENYVPSTAVKRIQYAYSAADLLVADDVFFEPEI